MIKKSFFMNLQRITSTRLTLPIFCLRKDLRFKMGILLFSKYGFEVSRAFVKQLQSWATQHRAEFSTRDVLNCWPRSLGQPENVIGKTADMALSEATSLCANDLNNISELYHNFARVVSAIEGKPKT